MDTASTPITLKIVESYISEKTGLAKKYVEMKRIIKKQN